MRKSSYILVKSLLALVVVLVLVLVAMPTPRAVMAGDVGTVVDLVMLPSSQVVNTGDTFDITFEARCNRQDVSGVAAFADFDPDYLEVQSIIVGTELSTELWNTYDNVRGTADYSAGTLTPP